MAGAGYKLFNTGDVLTAAQVNTYLQEQVVMVFADATARTTALSGVLAEGMVSYLKDTNATEVYDGSAWVGIGNSGDITGVTAGTGISGGGTSGTVTITNDMATTITAAGDIVVGTGSGTYDNLPIGTTGQVLTADTTVSPYKVKWATSSSGSTFAGCRAEVDNSQQLISNNTDTVVTLPTEVFDTDGFHSTSSNTGRITIPSGKAGYYLFYGYVNFSSNTTGNRRLKFSVNNTTGSAERSCNAITGSSGLSLVYLTAVINCAVGDYVNMIAFQDSGGNLYLQSTGGFGCAYLGA
jgi:hypothetical protein